MEPISELDALRQRAILSSLAGLARIEASCLIPMSAIHELSNICAEQNPNPADQRRRLVKLLKSGADIHATDKNGVTALHHAVRFRSPSAVKTLIEFGANVNQVCRRSGSTPLHRAVTSTGAPSSAGKQRETIEIIRLLIEAGADPSICNKSGRKPAEYVRVDAIKSLLHARRAAAVFRDGGK
jgi:tankyrase